MVTNGAAPRFAVCQAVDTHCINVLWAAAPVPSRKLMEARRKGRGAVPAAQEPALQDSHFNLKYSEIHR